MWSVADGAWRQLLTDRLEKFKTSRNWDFNTPKPTQVDKLFMDALGINKISDSWSWDKTTSEMARKKLMGFVELRGAIAHRGKSDDSVKKITVTGYLELVSRLAGKTGGVVNRHCRKITGKHLYVKRPTSVLAE